MRVSNLLSGKTRQEKLDQLGELHYTVSLRHNDSKFYLIISELSLVAVDENLEEAYKKLDAQKRDYFFKVLDCEAEDEIILPHKLSKVNDTLHQLKIYVLKLLIIAVIGVLTLSTSFALVSQKLANLSAVDVVKKVVKEIVVKVGAATINAPEEKKRERLESFRQFIEEMRPLVHEFNVLFLPPDPEEPKKKNGDP